MFLCRWDEHRTSKDRLLTVLDVDGGPSILLYKLKDGERQRASRAHGADGSGQGARDGEHGDGSGRERTLNRR